MEYYLFFDTETNDVPLNYKADANNVQSWPRLMELGFQIYNEHGELMTEQTMIIKPEGFDYIAPQASAIHGITLEKANRVGVPLKYALNCFHNVKKFASKTIAYNMRFDKSVVNCEFIRSGKNGFDWSGEHCEMLKATDILRIPNPHNWATGYKWPSLLEYHEFCFDVGFDGAHSALADVQAMADCFFHMKKVNEL